MKLALFNIVAEDDFDQLAPVGLGYLKSYLERESTRVEASILSSIDELWDGGFDAVGLSCMSQDYCRAQAIAADVKTRLGIPIILGGFHISMLPGSLAPTMDVGVVGEGEQTLVDLVELFERQKHFAPEDLKNIPGLVYRAEDGRLERTSHREEIRPLDRLPFPDRAAGKREWQSIYMFSSRGCPYRCVFCSSARFWKKTRYFSPEYVMSELQHIVETYPSAKTISFSDDLFVADRGRFRRIVESIERQGYAERHSFTANVRADLVDEELCELLVRGGIRQVSFGLESANQRVLNELKCGTLSVSRCQDALDMLSRHHLVVNCTYIVGTPGETEDEARETFEFVRRGFMAGTIAEAYCNIMCPLPGTPVWDAALRDGFVSEDMDWNRLSCYTWTGGGNYNLLSVDDWIARRERDQSLYINPCVPVGRLYELIREYEEKTFSSKMQVLAAGLRPRIVPWLRDIAREKRGARVVCYGACDMAGIVIDEARNEGISVVGVADGNRQKQGRNFGGFTVIDRHGIAELKPDAVLICSQRRAQEICSQIEFLEAQDVAVYTIPG
jgi:radical SAM superfamily enzyme YgiQ (UPF0313 family)